MRKGGTPPFDFQLVNIDVALFSLPGLTLQSVTDLPLPALPTYGEDLLVEGQYVYAYGTTRQPLANNFPTPRHYVARAPLGSVLDASAWRFWQNVPAGQDPWASNAAQDADPMLFDNSATGGPLAGFSVGFNGSYVGSAFPIDVFATDTIVTWNGAGPGGPWTRRPIPAITGVNTRYGQLAFPTRFAYGGRVVFNVPGGPIVQWSTNHESLDAVLADPNFYKVWFATPLPGSVPPSVATWYLRNSITPGPPDSAFAYGLPSYQPVVGDWDGNNTSTIGSYVSGTWYMRSRNSVGPPDVAVNYGSAAYTPVVGDWNGDHGGDTIGAYLNGWWYLRNSNTPGRPDVVVNYGAAGYTPVVGDWDGNGSVTIGAYLNGWWYLRNSNTPGPPDVVVNYGAAGYTPVVGDWDGNGSVTIGAYLNGWWYLRNSNTPGPPDVVVNYGAAGCTPVVGNWDGVGGDSIGAII